MTFLGGYRVNVRPDVMTDGSRCYMAEHPDLPGCIAYGRTIREARASLALAQAAYLQNLRDRGIGLPEPSAGTQYEWSQADPNHSEAPWEADGTPMSPVPATTP